MSEFRPHLFTYLLDIKNLFYAQIFSRTAYFYPYFKSVDRIRLKIEQKFYKTQTENKTPE